MSAKKSNISGRTSITYARAAVKVERIVLMTKLLSIEDVPVVNRLSALQK